MKVIQQSYEILTDLSDPIKILKDIERAGRICYKSTHNITDDSCFTFCKNILNRAHEAVIEHSQFRLKLTRQTKSGMILNLGRASIVT
jgi:thymidylate synthase (FAD)